MLSFNRRAFLFGSAGFAGLSACGFTPAYGPNGAANGLLGTILVDEPTDRDAFLLVQQLETRLGRASIARFAMSTKLKITQEQVAISANNITQRFNLIGRVDFALRDATTDAEITKGTVDSFTGYSATGTTAATQAAKRDAQERLMIILADEIVTRLIATAPTLNL